jgi:hypothetical protein
VGHPEINIKDVCYVDVEWQSAFDPKKLYKSFAFAVNALLTFTESFKLQRTCIHVLKRMYALMPDKYRQMFEDPIQTCLHSLALLSSTTSKLSFSTSILHLLLSDPIYPDSFKDRLKADLILHPIH